MISQGTNGLYRGDMRELIMKGKTMLSFLLQENLALDRSSSLSKCIKGWDSTLGREMEVLYPYRWFELGNNYDGGYINVDGF